MDKEIEAFVNACNPCQSVMKCPTKTDLQSWPIPTKPWSRIHMDIGGPVNNQFLLIIVDAHSKYLEVAILKTITTSKVVSVLEEIFGCLGVCDTIVTDNGTQFTSNQFDELCKLNNIKHLRTATFHPQSNGQAERFVDTVQRTLRKLSPEGRNLAQHLSTFLQTYLSTPNPISHQTPFEMMFGRKMVTPLNAMLPSKKDSSIENIAQNNAFNMKRGTKSNKFIQHEKIYMMVHSNNKWSWQRGTIVKTLENRMYIVSICNKEKTARVHANQLRHDKS